MPLLFTGIRLCQMNFGRILYSTRIKRNNMKVSYKSKITEKLTVKYQWVYFESVRYTDYSPDTFQALTTPSLQNELKLLWFGFPIH